MMKREVKGRWSIATERPSGKTTRKVNMPFSEAGLLKGLDAERAHADELAQASAAEMGERYFKARAARGNVAQALEIVKKAGSELPGEGDALSEADSK